jgi:predicted dehydrogenase
MINVGIIGFGKMGMLHGALMNGSGKARIAAICDKSFIMRYGFKKFYPGVKCYTDVDIMFKKSDLDAVIIATPTFNHVESIKKAMDRNCDVFVEKPLASDIESSEKLIYYAEKANSKIQVGFCNRFAPPINLGRKLINDNIIGRVEEVKAYMFIGDVLERHSGWRFKKALSGGGVLIDFGIHMVDLLCWYFGNLQTVSSLTRKLYSVEVEDEMDAELEFRNGVHAHFETSWSKEDYRKSYTKMDVYGSEGKLEITDQTLRVFDTAGTVIQNFSYPDLYGGAFMDIGGILYSNQINAFFDLVETGNSAGASLREAAYVQKVIDCLYKSAASGEAVALGE